MRVLSKNESLQLAGGKYKNPMDENSVCFIGASIGGAIGGLVLDKGMPGTVIGVIVGGILFSILENLNPPSSYAYKTDL